MERSQSNSDTFVVFGATGGIGSAVCRGLYERGARLVVAARNPDRLQALATELGAAPVVVDATRIDDVERCIQTATQDGQEIAGLVNCVGSILLKPAHLTSADDWNDTIALNLTSAFAVVRAAGLSMRRGGSVVLLSSAAAATGLTNHEAIAAAKSGVEGLVRAAAATYARRKLRFNAVAPGLVDTPMAARLTANPKAREASEAMHPLGRIGSAADIASAILWLLDPTNDWVTGQVIGVDGGLGTLRAT